MNQALLASRLELSQGTISSWFTRKTIPGTKTLEKLGEVFKVEPFYYLMPPGTQGIAKPIERNDDFDSFINELAEKHLDQGERDRYYEVGGAREYLRSLRASYETTYINTASWFLKLNAALAKYATIDFVEKVRKSMSKLEESNAKKA